ncbi:Hypothetical_protein [Hexamita inflata]|uniref:Hypothetical_protein n=1 Tax=Hexamita inflata TaxID=28002 RepID=A0AA86R9X8_9EUKA|nr:Hypothetical protein HINF_LOCUS56394 [Hexamita inflata]
MQYFWLPDTRSLCEHINSRDDWAKHSHGCCKCKPGPGYTCVKQLLKVFQQRRYFSVTNVRYYVTDLILSLDITWLPGQFQTERVQCQTFNVNSSSCLFSRSDIRDEKNNNKRVLGYLKLYKWRLTK